MNKVLASILFVASIKLGVSIDMRGVGNILERLHASGAAKAVASLIDSESANQASETIRQFAEDLGAETNGQGTEQAEERSRVQENTSKGLKIIIGSALLVVALTAAAIKGFG
jgi:hypothetical protein